LPLYINIQGNEVYKLMNKSWFYLGAISIVATLLTSCGESAKPPAPAATPAPAAATPPAVAPPTVPATPIAAATPTPIASVKSVGIKPVSVDVAAGLIAPTDGDNWAKTVSKGRADPFAMIALQPIEVAEIKDPFNPTVTSVAKSQIASNSQPKQAVTATNGSSPIKVSAKKSTIKISSRSLPKGINVAQSQPSITIGGKPAKVSKISAKGKIASNNSNPIAKVPASKKPSAGKNTQISAISRPAIDRALPKITTEIPAAKPEQANGMEVSGVIEVAGTTQVIVKLASESFSRYIEVGDRVANGRVLIKRVEGQNTLSPTVVLEEVGIEVPRKIGDRSTPITPDAAPKADPAK
jgi:hypothetical protein